MPFLELFDETLDINATDNYELSVQISQYELSFTILDTIRNKFVMFRSYGPDKGIKYYPADIETIVRTDDFLTRKFRRRNIITASPRTTLIPATLFDESKKTECYGFNHVREEKETLLSNRIEDQDIYVVFSMNDENVKVLNDFFPGNEIIHQIKPLFHNIYHSRRPVTGFIIHVHFEDEYMHLIIYDQNSLKFCNTFFYKTNSDIQYFVLYVLNRMNIRHDELIQFSGRARTREEIVTDFSAYFTNMRFAEPAGNYTLSYVFNEADLYRYLNIFSIVSCV